MAGRGRGKKGRGKKQPVKQSSRKMKDPTPPRSPRSPPPSGDDNREEADSRQSPSAAPASPVDSLSVAGDGDGPCNAAAATKPKKPRKDCKIDQKVEDDLIEWFRENDSLWNTQRSAYRDKARRQRLIATKAEELGISSDHLWTWFKSLRDMFTRLDKKKSGDGQPIHTDREKWILDRFAFFQHAVHHRSKPTKSVSIIHTF